MVSHLIFFSFNQLVHLLYFPGLLVGHNQQYSPNVVSCMKYCSRSPISSASKFGLLLGIRHDSTAAFGSGIRGCNLLLKFSQSSSPIMTAPVTLLQILPAGLICHQPQAHLGLEYVAYRDGSDTHRRFR